MQNSPDFAVRNGHNLDAIYECHPQICSTNEIHGGDCETVPMIVKDSSGREMMRLTNDRKIVFADDVTPQDAARVFAESVGQCIAFADPNPIVIENV